MRWGLFTVIIAPVLVLGIFVGYNLTAPADFPHGAIVRIEEGVGLYTLAERLKDEGVIRSPFFFRAVAILMGGERQMKAGHYYVPEREGTLHLAYRILHGRYGLKRYKLTIPEGFTVKKISGAFDEKFPFFDNTYFEREAREGYLFPDTYFVYETATASSTLALFADNFRKKVDPLQSEIVVAGKTLAEIMTMASIIEGEAKTPEDKTIVSGILWKRIKLGLPLQVDASFVYFLGKSTREITQDDLKIDSPYNTYLYRGLPPTPISNPGLESIKAAIHPTTTPYLYFLTADDGTMHYSRTFEEHVAAKQRYLRTR